MKRKHWYRRLILLALCVWMLSGSASASFPDVQEGSASASAIAEMEAKGLLSGFPDGNFYPARTITAAQFVTIAVRCAGLPEVPGQTAHWASGTMQAALQAGWYDWDELPPDGKRYDLPIPRQLAVKILMRAFLPDLRGDYLTESRKISDFQHLNGRYYEPVLAAYAAGVVQGDSQGCFRPEGSLTRAAACILFRNVLNVRDASAFSPAKPVPSAPPVTPAAKGGVSENGWLQVRGNQLCNEKGEAVVLRGMSSHGLQWYGQYADRESIANTARLGANVFRAAMYTEEGGYLSNPAEVFQKAANAVDAAIANDLYVILDWHILSDGNPMNHLNEAKTFFSAMAERYQNSPAVLYEICNEPNGAISWEKDIKPYAEQVISVIRAKSPKAVILVGSGTWSQDVHLAASSPLKGENLMYTLHFYAGTHGEALRQRLDSVWTAGLPVFVSEWGTSRADGSGGVFLKESGEWLDFLEKRNISWVNWSLCDKNETSAALQPGTPPDKVWTQEDWSESGSFVFSRFR